MVGERTQPVEAASSGTEIPGQPTRAGRASLSHSAQPLLLWFTTCSHFHPNTGRASCHWSRSGRPSRSAMKLAAPKTPRTPPPRKGDEGQRPGRQLHGHGELEGRAALAKAVAVQTPTRGPRRLRRGREVQDESSRLTEVCNSYTRKYCVRAFEGLEGWNHSW